MRMGTMDAFLARLDHLPEGFGNGLYEGKTWGVTVNRSGGNARVWLYGEELGGPDRVSFNLYRTQGGKTLLKPCEMPDKKVIVFVLGYEPSALPSHSTR